MQRRQPVSPGEGLELAFLQARTASPSARRGSPSRRCRDAGVPGCRGGASKGCAEWGGRGGEGSGRGSKQAAPPPVLGAPGVLAGGVAALAAALAAAPGCSGCSGGGGEGSSGGGSSSEHQTQGQAQLRGGPAPTLARDRHRPPANGNPSAHWARPMRAKDGRRQAPGKTNRLLKDPSGRKN